jgi:hypothetical protein
MVLELQIFGRGKFPKQRMVIGENKRRFKNMIGASKGFCYSISVFMNYY